MSRNQGQRLGSHSLNFDLLSKSFVIHFNHITVSPQNFGKSSTHQKSPFLEVFILGNGLSVRSNPHIQKIPCSGDFLMMVTLTSISGLIPLISKIDIVFFAPWLPKYICGLAKPSFFYHCVEDFNFSKRLGNL